MIRMLQGIYKLVTASVRYGNETTEAFNCPLGVKQGCILSPLIFSLLINEVAIEIGRRGRAGYQFIPGTQEIYSLLFADDIALISTTPIGLQNQINNLKTAAETLGLQVNLDETKILVCRKGGYLGSREKWFYGKQQIEVVNSYKYLGFTITTKLSVDISLAEYAGRAKGKVIEIFKTLYKLGHINIDIFFQLFDAQVKPMLLYAAEIWGMTQYSTIEKVHTFACKKVLSMSLRTPNSLVYGELGRYPLYIDSAVRSLKYWFKILQLPQERLNHLAYLRELTEENKTAGWVNILKNSLETNGFAEVWLNKGTQNNNSFVKKFRQRLIDQFKQNWHEKITTRDRYNIYRTLKNEHKKEDYLNFITIIKYRKLLSKLRLGTLEIFYNRRFKDPEADTTCPFCEEIETEEHLLLDCPMYNNIRHKYLAKFWITLNNVNLTDLVTNKNAEIVKATAMYTYYALKYREENL